MSKSLAKPENEVKALQSYTSMPTGGLDKLEWIPLACADCELSADCGDVGVFFCAWFGCLDGRPKERGANASNKLVTCSQSLTEGEQGNG